jgi:hypothetical protein
MRIRKSGTKKKSKAPLALRLFICALAAVTLLIGSASIWNAHIVNSYNEASASLTNNLAAVKQPKTDIKKLTTSQQQVDSRFREMESNTVLLIPSVREAVEYNAHISHSFTNALLQEQEKSKSNNTSPNSPQQGANNDSEKKQGLTPEQQQQVEEMLKRNQELQNENPQTNHPNTKKKSEQQTKPW